MKFPYTTLVCAVVVAGCAGSKREPVVASVGGETVTLREYDKILASASGPGTGALLQTDAGKEQLLNDIIRGKLILAAAKQAGIQNRPEVQERIARLRVELDDYFRVQSDEIVGKEFVREQMLRADKEADAYYAAHQTELQNPVEIKTRQMLLPTENQANELLKQARAGRDFSELARQHSVDKVTAPLGGEMDYFGRGQCPFGVQVEEASFSLKNPGDLSAPTATTSGWRLIQLVAKRPAQTVTVEETMFRIRSMLKTQKYDEIVTALAQQIKIEVNTGVLARAAVENTTSTPAIHGKLE